MNRICPDDILLSEYLSGVLGETEISFVEKHLTSCVSCRNLVIETYSAAKESLPAIILNKIITITKNHLWGILAIIAVASSFLVPRYFIQLLCMGMLLGLKWIIDAKTMKMLIMINESWKNRNSEKKDSEVTHRNSR